MKSLLMISTIVIIIVTFPLLVAGQESQDKEVIHSIELPAIQVQLNPGPGLDKVSSLCNVCHTLKYITMQPAFPRATWTAEVNKMIKVMGAPINDEDAKTIIDYLSTAYGTGK
jgi:sulfite dehydrogenase (cytochrome) subunit B